MIADFKATEISMNTLSDIQSISTLCRRHLLAVDREEPWETIWQSMVLHPWVQQEVDRSARRLMRKNSLPRQLLDDVKQEALLALANSLKKRPSLGFDLRHGHYESYLRIVLYRCCQRATKALRHPGHQELVEHDHPQFDPWCEIVGSIDLKQAIDQLKEPYRSTIQQVFEGVPLQTIARGRRENYRTIYRWYNKAIDQIRHSFLNYNI